MQTKLICFILILVPSPLHQFMIVYYIKEVYFQDYTKISFYITLYNMCLIFI